MVIISRPGLVYRPVGSLDINACKLISQQFFAYPSLDPGFRLSQADKTPCQGR